jgi:hypothetical protein
VSYLSSVTSCEARIECVGVCGEGRRMRSG